MRFTWTKRVCLVLLANKSYQCIKLTISCDTICCILPLRWWLFCLGMDKLFNHCWSVLNSMNVGIVVSLVFAWCLVLGFFLFYSPFFFMLVTCRPILFQICEFSRINIIYLLIVPINERQTPHPVQTAACMQTQILFNFGGVLGSFWLASQLVSWLEFLVYFCVCCCVGLFLGEICTGMIKKLFSF